MALRYIVTVAHLAPANNRILIDALKAAHLVEYTALPGLTVYMDPDSDCIVLPEERGVLIGDLFTQTSPPKPVTGIDEAEGQRICASRGGHLLTHYWGGYVGVIRCPVTARWTAIRDSSGMLPCYRIMRSDHDILASDVETLVDAGLLAPALDRNAIVYTLNRTGPRSQHTCLEGLSELLPGFSVEFDGSSRAPEMRWSPWDYVQPDYNLTPDLAAQRLQATVSECVQAWAGKYGSAAIGVSGGLDSSIVAAELSAGRTPWIAYTLATRDREGDERAFARTLTRFLDVPLTERFYDPRHVTIGESGSSHLPRPTGHLLQQSYEHILRDIGQEAGIGAFFSGAGGDNVFAHTMSVSPLFDRLRSSPFEPGLIDTLNDLCDLTGCSYWDALYALLRKLVRGHRNAWKSQSEGLSADVVKESKADWLHPWLKVPRGALFGQIEYIVSLLNIQDGIEGFSRYLAAPSIAPLLSQPIVEFCLSIPRWWWIEGGRDRALARRAYEGMLPQSLIKRQSKGGPDPFVIEVIEVNRTRLKDYLLSGWLAKNEIIDMTAIERILSDICPIRAPDHIVISCLAEAEAWCQHWDNAKREPISAQVDY